jgi:hypothetical protein
LRSEIFARSSERRSGWYNFALPLKFPSILSELNVLSILALLNFDSGYREPLREVTGRGVPQSVRAFVFSLYISSSIDGEGNLLSAQGLQNIADVKVADLLGVNIHVERPHETLQGVTVGEMGGPLLPFVKLISKTLREAGEALVILGYPDLGTFVLESLKDGEKARAKSGAGADVEVVLERASQLVILLSAISFCRTACSSNTRLPRYVRRKLSTLVSFLVFYLCLTDCVKSSNVLLQKSPLSDLCNQSSFWPAFSTSTSNPIHTRHSCVCG